MLVITNKVDFEDIYAMPKGSRKELLEARETAGRNGYAGYKGHSILRVANAGTEKPSMIRVHGRAGERSLRVMYFAELRHGDADCAKWWKFYFCVDPETKPHPDFVDETFLAGADVDPGISRMAKSMTTIKHVTPRRLYVASNSYPNRYQQSFFEMNDLKDAEGLLSKPRGVIVQREYGFEVIADVVGKEKKMSLGSALMLEAGELYEVS
ncbi:MAG: hypothetical protein HYT71_01830 [Candidatus Aenigmarchaeota archaeon]|nr:hypothetical protein [Candidatus Aenigmarchaeota archaeon]